MAVRPRAAVPQTQESSGSGVGDSEESSVRTHAVLAVPIGEGEASKIVPRRPPTSEKSETAQAHRRASSLLLFCVCPMYCSSLGSIANIACVGFAFCSRRIGVRAVGRLCGRRRTPFQDPASGARVGRLPSHHHRSCPEACIKVTELDHPRVQLPFRRPKGQAVQLSRWSPGGLWTMTVRWHCVESFMASRLRRRVHSLPDIAARVPSDTAAGVKAASHQNSNAHKSLRRFSST
jgi:hypothetical protein